MARTVDNLRPDGWDLPVAQALVEPVLMAGTHQDITASKLAELQLRESEARYRALHDSLPVGCILQDVNHRILAVNDEACTIFKVDKNQLLDKRSQITSRIP